MYFIDKPEDLVGKTIAFIHAAQFAEAITLGTTDGGIMVVEQDDEREINVYAPHRAEHYVFTSNREAWMIEELKKCGVVGETDYEDLCALRRKQIADAKQKDKKRHEAAEYAEYQRLKEKYEGIGPEITSFSCASEMLAESLTKSSKPISGFASNPHTL